MAGMPFWPRFDPRTTPLAIYDGADTWLFRHPGVPPGFTPAAGAAGALMMRGRHAAVNANSSALFGGVTTATLLPDLTRGEPRRWAATLMHETFHVFQRVRHATWQGNEAELFAYPVDRADALTLRRIESIALARALAETDHAQSRCWARGALAARHERFILLGSGAAGYERASELNEGLAEYIGQRAANADLAEVIPPTDFGPEEIRQRVYASGAALAHLLDRHFIGWRDSLESNDAQHLDVMLADIMSRDSGVPCSITSTERATLVADAIRDVAGMRVARERLARDFEARDGWRLSVVPGSPPLFPQRFDPLNVKSLGGGRVLHTRFVRLGNDRGAVEVLGAQAMSEAAGTHPLFNGVRRLSVTGLAAEPSVTQSGDSTIIAAPGVRAAFVRAAVARDGRALTVTLPP